MVRKGVKTNKKKVLAELRRGKPLSYAEGLTTV